MGLLRGLVPVAAGIARMPVGRFIAWNVTASVAWAGAVITLGFLLGDSIARFLERWGALLLVGAVVALAGYAAFRVLGRSVHDAGADEAAAAEFCAPDVPKLDPGAAVASRREEVAAVP